MFHDLVCAQLHYTHSIHCICAHTINMYAHTHTHTHTDTHAHNTHTPTHLVSLGSKAQNVIEDMGYSLLMYILCREEGRKEGRGEEGQGGQGGRQGEVKGRMFPK